MTSTDALAAVILDHRIGPGGRCACRQFMADRNPERLARHLATAIATTLDAERAQADELHAEACAEIERLQAERARAEAVLAQWCEALKMVPVVGPPSLPTGTTK